VFGPLFLTFWAWGEQQMNYLQLIERKFAKYFRVSACLCDDGYACDCMGRDGDPSDTYTPCVRCEKKSHKNEVLVSVYWTID